MDGVRRWSARGRIGCGSKMPEGSMGFVGVGGGTVRRNTGLDGQSVCERRRRAVVGRAKNATKYTEFEPLEQDLRDYLKSVPNTESVEEEEEDGDVKSPIGYAKLAKAGRFDLLEGIMAYGGYLEVSRRMGLEVILEEKEKPKEDQKVVFKRTSGMPDEGFLTLGGAKAQRLSDKEVSTAMQLAKEKDARKRVEAEARKERERKYGAPSLLSRIRRLPQGLEPAKKIPEGETFQFSAFERLGFLAFFGLFAVAFGRLGSDNLAEGVQEILKKVAGVIFVLHIGEAFYLKRMAEQKNRNSFLWALKGFLTGQPSVARLSKLPTVPKDES